MYNILKKINIFLDKQMYDVYDIGLEGKVYYYCFNYYRNKTCENNKSISENGLIEIINEKLNLTNITRLELENKVKYTYIDKDKNVKIDFK